MGEFGERRGDPQGGWGVDAEFVVAAAGVLHEARLSGGARDRYAADRLANLLAQQGRDKEPQAEV
jgi:hypothetical protein